MLAAAGAYLQDAPTLRTVNLAVFAVFSKSFYRGRVLLISTDRLRFHFSPWQSEQLGLTMFLEL